MTNQKHVYTQDWTTFLSKSLSRIFPQPVTGPKTAVEIGSFEGRGTRLLFNYLIEPHKDSRLLCVDPWRDEYVSSVTLCFAGIDPLFAGQYQRFLRNTEDLGNRVITHRGTSNEVLPMLTARLDFTYIDGDHSPGQVFRDASMVLPLMKKGGIILFDDYRWEHNGVKCSEGIDRWLEVNNSRINILFKDDQVAVSVATPISYHVYAVCWNEERLLPAFLHHYRDAERIVVYDNESNDRSREIITAAGREVRIFSTNGTLNDETNRKIKNEAWKESAGSADWVIVQDLDEFVHFPRHPDSIINGLAELRAIGVTLVKTVAHNIYCTDEEWGKIAGQQSVVTQITRCKRITWYDYDKCLVFNPAALKKIGYDAGCHTCNPTGTVVSAPTHLRPMLLHFKHIGERYELEKRIAIRNRLSKQNKELGQGFQYIKSDEAHRLDTRRIYMDSDISKQCAYAFPSPWIITQPLTDVPSFAVLTQGAGDFISDRLGERKAWEPRVASVIGALCRPALRTVFLDVGANIGLHSFVALSSGAVKTIAIECHPRTARVLRRGFMSNGWPCDRFRIVTAAASAVTGNVLPFRECASNLGGSQIVLSETKAAPADYQVRTLALDGLAPEIENCDTVVIKLDIEGHEPEAIRGMTNLLHDPRTRCLLIEFNPMMRAADVLIDMAMELRSMGFETIKCLLRHPPDEWASSASRTLQIEEVDDLWANSKPILPDLSWEDLQTTLRQGTTVLEVLLLRR